VYRDLSPRAVNELGHLVVDAYSPWMGTAKIQWDKQQKQREEVIKLLRESMESV